MTRPDKREALERLDRITDRLGMLYQDIAEDRLVDAGEAARQAEALLALYDGLREGFDQQEDD